MIRNVLILGSGKMALNIGIRLLRAGINVAWWSSSTNRLAELEKRVSRATRRVERIAEASGLGQPRFLGCEDGRFGSVDLILESTAEDLERKRRVVAWGERFRQRQTILISNSSSILPWDINVKCVGMHFFYPVELHPVAELIFSESTSEGTKLRVIDFALQAGIEPLIENERNAFFVNRLLLPLQNEAFRALRSGMSAECVDKCSASELFPNPVLTYMDHVGLDVVLRSAEGYVARMPGEEQESYGPLLEGLREAVAAGMLGNKAKMGIRRLYRHNRRDCRANERIGLSEEMDAVLLNSVLWFIEDELLEQSSFDRVVEMIWGGKGSIDMIVQRDGVRLFERLQETYDRTGLLYFEPAPVLKSF